MKQVSRFLSRTQVAFMFGVSSHTVTRWAKEGKLAHIVTPGGQYRFPRHLIEDRVRKLMVS